MSEDSSILVTGATGNLGSEVVRQLIETGLPTRAAVRNPASYRAPEGLRGTTAFDYERPERFDTALDGVEAVVLIPRPLDAAAEAVMTPFIDAAARAGVRQVTLSTALRVDQYEPSPLRNVERHLERSGLSYTLVRPNFFMDNFSGAMFDSMIREQGAVSVAAGESQSSFIAATDIAAVIVDTLRKPEHQGKVYNLTGPEALDHHAIAAAISEVSGRSVSYQPISEDDLKAAVRAQGMSEPSADFLAKLYQLTRAGYYAAVTDDVERVTGRPPMRFSDFAWAHARAWKTA